jgi:hypothetical protein
MESSLIIQAVNGKFYKEPTIFAGDSLFYTRDGIAYGAARNFKRSSPKSARSRMISELHAQGIKGAAAKEGEFTSTLIGDALVPVWAFEWILDAPIPVPHFFLNSLDIIPVDQLVNPVIGFFSEEERIELERFYEGGENLFLTTVMGGSPKLARRRIGIVLRMTLDDKVLLHWKHNFFGMGGERTTTLE